MQTSDDAATEFVNKLIRDLGPPRVGASNQDEKRKRMQEKCESFALKLSKFSRSVLERAADFLVENRKSFPALSDCLQACSQIEASDKAALSGGQTSRKGVAKDRDWSDPNVAKAADDMIGLSENLPVALDAMRGGWLLDLWLFSAQKGRMPVGCDSDGVDERYELQQKRLKINADAAEMRAHPYGSICNECAAERGATPIPGHTPEPWLGRCMHCCKDLDSPAKWCTALTDWNWPRSPHFNPAALTKLIGLRAAVERKTAQQIARLEAPIHEKKAA